MALYSLGQNRGGSSSQPASAFSTAVFAEGMAGSQETCHSRSDCESQFFGLFCFVFTILNFEGTLLHWFGPT